MRWPWQREPDALWTPPLLDVHFSDGQRMTKDLAEAQARLASAVAEPHPDGCQCPNHADETLTYDKTALTLGTRDAPGEIDWIEPDWINWTRKEPTIHQPTYEPALWTRTTPAYSGWYWCYRAWAGAPQGVEYVHLTQTPNGLVIDHSDGRLARCVPLWWLIPTTPVLYVDQDLDAIRLPRPETP